MNSSIQVDINTTESSKTVTPPQEPSALSQFCAVSMPGKIITAIMLLAAERRASMDAEIAAGADSTHRHADLTFSLQHLPDSRTCVRVSESCLLMMSESSVVPEIVGCLLEINRIDTSHPRSNFDNIDYYPGVHSLRPISLTLLAEAWVPRPATLSSRLHAAKSSPERT